jgi:SecD/SecF fusion protein
MFQRIYLKFFLTLALVGWALFSVYPLRDRPFSGYLKAETTGANKAEFLRLMDRVAQRVQSGQSKSPFVALKEIGKEEKLDLSKFFPQVRLERTLRNIEKRNDILLDYLLKESKGKLQLGLDLNGGVAFILEAQASALVEGAGKNQKVMREEKLAKAVDILGTRINALGVAEPLIRPVGENRIEVQLPGVSVKENPDVVDAVKKPARLDFRLVSPQFAALAEPPPLSAIPPGYEIMTNEDDDANGRPVTRYYAVKRIPEMTGEGVKDAYPGMDQMGGYEIRLQFNADGAKRFADVTGSNVGRLLGIVLDGKLYSAPRINDRIGGGSAQITGKFSQREAIELANVLNNPLDVPLTIKQQSEIGPSLAQDAVDNGVKASVIGATLVCAFMITYYTTGGLIAVFTLIVNVIIILGVMATLGSTLTLPGLAGIVLTMGMAVDANILVYERMREELNLGKSLQAAHDAGYEKAIWTILDSHITQLSICAVMIWLGTGPIKGFGVTLAIGVFSTLFSVLVTGRVVMDFLIERGWMTRMPMLHLFSNVKLDWVKIGKPAFIISWTVVLIGVGAIFLRADRILGIDFTGGDQVTLSFAQHLDIADIRKAATVAGITDINPAYQSDLANGKEVLKIEMPYGKTAALVAALQKAYPQAQYDKTGEDAIGASIGKEIAGNAALSVGLALAAILLYIAFRFEFGFGMGAVIATVHDVLMTVGMFVLIGGALGYQFNAPMVAAILAIIGYSVNDTVVVFDRIREELRLNPDTNLRDVVNLAINRVFSRSLMTSVTTFLAAAALFIFGSGVLRELAFTFLIGIITGTFSSICIAAQFFYWWHKGERKHVADHKDIAPKYEWEGASKASR